MNVRVERGEGVGIPAIVLRYGRGCRRRAACRCVGETIDALSSHHQVPLFKWKPVMFVSSSVEFCHSLPESL